MDKYLNTFWAMISLRGLTNHTLKNYCTYIRAYLTYLSDILHTSPEDVSWDQMHDFIRWLKKSRNLSDGIGPAGRKFLGAVPSIIQVLHIWN